MSGNGTADPDRDMFQPGTSDLMLQIADRAGRMYFLAQNGNWRYAKHELRKMTKKLDAVTLRKPNYAEAIADFKTQVCEALHKAIHDESGGAFDAAWTFLLAETERWHIELGFGFIGYSTPTSPPSGLDLSSPFGALGNNHSG